MKKGFQLESSSLEAVARKAEAVFNDTRTATEKLAAKQKELSQLFTKGAIDTDTFGRAMSQLKGEMAAVQAAPLEAAMRRAESIFNETRTAEEKLIAKQKELDQIFKSGVMDVDTYARATTKLKGELAAVNAAPLEAAMRKGESVFNDTRTAEEKLITKTKELNQLLKVGAIDIDTHTRALKQAESAMKQGVSATDAFRSRLSGLIGDIKAMAGAYLGFQAVTGIGKMADDMTGLDAQIRRTTESEKEFASVQKQLMSISTDTRAGLDETVKLYTKSANALKEYGYNNQEVLRFTELTNKAMATGGSSAAEQTAALQQLSQALASGKLQGDEFRSMAENSPIFLDIMSKSLGVTRGELRQMSSDGKLTTEVIMKAVMGQSEMIDKAFKKMPMTVGGAINQVKTSMMSFFDTTLVQSGIMTGLANAISGVAKHFGTLAIAATTIGAVALANVAIGAAAAGTGLLAMGEAALAAGRAMLMAAFSNPFTAVIAGVGLAIAALYEFRDATIEVNGAQTSISDVASDVWETVKSVSSDAWNIVKSVADDGLAYVNSLFPGLSINWSEVWAAIKSTVGTTMANVVDITIGAIPNIISAWQWLGNEIKAIVRGIVDAASSMISSIGAAVDAVRAGNFSGAAGSIKNIFSDAGNAYDKARGQMGDFTRFSTKAADYLGGKFNQAATNRQAANYGKQEGSNRGGGGGGAKSHGGGGGGGGKKGGGGGGGKAESKVGGMETELTTLKRAYELSHDLRELSKTDEIAYWKSKLATVAKGSKDAESIEKKIAQLSYESEKSALKNKLALTEMTKEQTLKIENEKLDEELKFAQFRNEMGSLSGTELLTIEADIETRRFELMRKSMQDRIALLEKDPTKNVVEVAKVQAQIEDLTRAHNARLTEIDRKTLKEKQTMWSGVTSSMEGLWDKGLDALMQGTLTWKNASKAIVADLGRAFGQMAANMAKNWVKQNAQKLLSDRATAAKQWLLEKVKSARTILTKQITAAREKAIDKSTAQSQNNGLMGTLSKFIATMAQKLSAKLGFAAQESTIEKAGAAQSVSTTMTKATTEITAGSVVAGTEAAKSQAGIPIVGPALAIAAMGAMMAAVGGMTSKLPSARGGFDIPAGMNPLTQLHEQEMVLPAKHADVIRAMADGNSGNRGGDTHFTIPVSYTDNSGRLTPEDIDRNSRHLAKAIKKEFRNFTLKNG